MTASFLIQEDNFVGLANGLQFLFLLPLLEVAFFDALTWHAKLGGLFYPFELVTEKL